MAIEFNSAALSAFRKVDFGNADAIANLGGKNGIVQNGKLGFFLWKPFRSGKTEDRNNAVRTELLKALGQSFGLAGMSEKEGKVTFSAEFMKKLEGMLGRDVLKTGDFSIGADGTVKSGKPLTQRRIETIVSKALKVGGEFDVKYYEKQLSAIQKEIAAKKGDGVNFYASVKRALDFYKNEIDRVIVKNEHYDPKATEDLYDNETSPYLMFDYGKGRYVPLKSGGQLRDHLTSDTIPGNPLKMYIHLENVFPKLGDTTIYGDKEFNRLKGYLTNVVRSYVELSVDCYLAAKKNPQAMRKFGTFLGHYDYCLDGRATELAEFAMKNLPEISAPAVNAAPGAPEEPEDELRIPPDKIPDHTEKTRLDDCLYKEIYAVKAALPKAKSWEGIAGAIKKRMVGLTRPIATLDNNGSIVPLMENGSPVVRKVTAEDIDRIGPACCDITCVF